MDKEKIIGLLEDFLDSFEEYEPIDEDSQKVGLEQVKELYKDTLKDEDKKWAKRARPLQGLNEAIVQTPEIKENRKIIVEDLQDDHDAYERAIHDILGKVRKINGKLKED